MVHDITIEEWLALREKGELTLIDVRSPSEYEETTIPGSVNVPLFDDSERAEIGTLYKKTSIQAAKDRGLEVVSAKLPAFIRTIASIPGKKAVFCWRGGMRSRTTATLLSLMDIRVSRIAGGYRAYRKWVVDTLASFDIKPEAFVLHGLTGTGKTAILQAMAERGIGVLDLERLAGHRGSIFGEIGMKARNQKTFESLLLEELLRLRNEPFVVFEAESRRIGKATLPDFLVRKKEEGAPIWIELPFEERVKRILQDYKPWEHPLESLEAFRKIKSRIHTPIAAEIETCLKEGGFERAASLLLEYYYDPLYEHTATRYEDKERTVVRASTIEEAIESVETIVRNKEKASERG
ncbi:tRNA 2-selenouridine(34) synthase MnmH [Cohnella suwonensis]|uniref:tRNA 2-selenouridine(34) synthase MnmH n=1 Tax=Cohnella suwonensis TaxID=696072 RepID=A0ABW0LZ43_9BACL